MEAKPMNVIARSAFLLAAVSLSWPLPSVLYAQPDYASQRQQLVEEIQDDVRLTSRYIGRDSFDQRVLDAIAHVPRHEFVAAEYRDQAYRNHPLPIGYGQTISQPYIVALMTDLAAPTAEDRVLEIGTGSGYQAAILAQLVKQVYSVEIIQPLASRAADTFHRLQYKNITSKAGDGYYGWPEHAPFDAILVTAAASHIPPPLLQQLKPGGRLVIPVGSRFLTQQLVLVSKDAQGHISSRQILPVQFVPLTGGPR